MQIIATAANKRLVVEHNNRVHAAWNTAALIRAKKMPPLASLQMKLRNRRTGPRPTLEQQRLLVRAMATAWGAERVKA